MHCTCVRHTELPHTSRLLVDVLYHPDRTQAFYRHWRRDLEAYRESAAEIRFPDEKRAALIAALRVRNPESDSLARLAQPGTVAVMTGQQVGLFSGPAYTVYKALHAAKLAAWLTENGVPAVPAFWLATEDHDFAEVNHAWVYGPDFRPVKLEMRRSASAQPVGEVTLGAPPVRELRGLLQGLPFGDDVTDAVEEAYRAGSTMGKAFGELLRRILARFDILQVDPMLPEFRELAAPALRAAVEHGPELTAGVLERNRELAAAGYHAQVHVEEQTSFVFLLENGKRLGLRRHGAEYGQNGRTFTADELAGRAASLSPNALLRPVVQDSMLPTVAYIGGPAEVAYLAQSQPIYEKVLGRQPVAVPRAGFTVLDAGSAERMERYGLQLADFLAGEEALREKVAARLVPPGLHEAVRGAAARVDEAVGGLKRELLAFDPTLAKALERSTKKIHHQMEKMQAKTGRETLRRDARARAEAASLYGLVYPERHLQERLYSFLPLAAQHGWELVDRVYDAVQIDCSDHRVMVV